MHSRTFYEITAVKGDWPNRTMHGAHLYIESHWDELRSGDVVDSRVGLGETQTAVESERTA